MLEQWTSWLMESIALGLGHYNGDPVYLESYKFVWLAIMAMVPAGIFWVARLFLGPFRCTDNDDVGVTKQTPNNTQ